MYSCADYDAASTQVSTFSLAKKSGRLQAMKQRDQDEAYATWTSDRGGEPSMPHRTLEEVRELVRVGIEELERGEFVTAAQLRAYLGCPEAGEA
jgi:hypothetical protein